MRGHCVCWNREDIDKFLDELKDDKYPFSYYSLKFKYFKFVPIIEQYILKYDLEKAVGLEEKVVIKKRRM